MITEHGIKSKRIQIRLKTGAAGVRAIGAGNMTATLHLDAGADLDTLARVLRAARAYRGYTQPELAELSGVNAETIAALEKPSRRKRGPHRRTLEKLAAALDIPMEEPAR